MSRSQTKSSFLGVVQTLEKTDALLHGIFPSFLAFSSPSEGYSFFHNKSISLFHLIRMVMADRIFWAEWLLDDDTCTMQVMELLHLQTWIDLIASQPDGKISESTLSSVHSFLRNIGYNPQHPDNMDLAKRNFGYAALYLSNDAANLAKQKAG